MTHDWLLVETLGHEPAVVAHGRHTKNLAPISEFLRRSPHLMSIQAAVAETVHTGHGLDTITPKHDLVIRTEVVRMSDGHIHGVHLWTGPPGEEPPDRPTPGPLKWDLTSGVATDTPESLANSGLDPATDATQGRAFAEDLPARDLNPNETRVLSLAVRPVPGDTVCRTWDVTDHTGELVTVGFVARSILETMDDGSERVICRAMNWRSERDDTPTAPDNPGQRLLDEPAQSGVHRALVDPDNWTLLKWIDDPCPYYDWRGTESGEPFVDPAEAAHMYSMATEFADGAAGRVLRLRGNGGGWVPMHVTVNRVELEADTSAGLISLRLPTEAELADPEPADSEPAGAELAGAPAEPPKRPRKSKPRRKDGSTKPAG
jgi:hypothetical protein